MANYEHFGIKIKDGKYGVKLTRENYAVINIKRTQKSKKIENYNHFKQAYNGINREKYNEIYTDESGNFYTDDWCNKMKGRALINFDLNMDFFSTLDNDEFNKALEKFLKKNNKFRNVSDLKTLDHIQGYYLMVIDDYCQLYIGTSKDIKSRISAHWTKKKEFDRLIFGSMSTSKLSVDSFRALDTTRIYIYETTTLFTLEDKFLCSIPNKFSCNRMGGGLPTKDNVEFTMFNSMKTRQL